jgi:prepilin-type N-terminal cleavage/methylation domain-containing protein
VCASRSRTPVWRDERGYTLPEVLTAVAVVGILAVVAVLVLLALLERWRVEAAAEQLASDMRLAHTKATQQLTDWRLVLAPKKTGADSGEGSGPDYYVVKLSSVYDEDHQKPTVTESTPRTLPADVKIREHKSETSNDNQGETRWISPVPPQDAAPDPTRTVEFNSDGTMAFFEGPANSACVTIDGNPMLRVKASYPSTSSIEVAEGDGSPCNVD